MMQTGGVSYCFITLMDLPDKLNHNFVDVSVETQTTTAPQQLFKHSDNVEYNRSYMDPFDFVWNISMSMWKITVKTKTDTYVVDNVPISAIMQDVIGGQSRQIPFKIGKMEIRISPYKRTYPSAYALHDLNIIQATKTKLFSAPISVVADVSLNPIIDSVFKHPYKLFVGLDLTGSNGDPTTNTNSLHSFDTTKNAYLGTMTKIGDMITYLSQDSFPVIGFGFAAQTSSSVSNHNFTEEFWDKNPPRGTGALIECYNRVLSKVKSKEIALSGPTQFSPVVTETLRISNKHDHNVLLLFTDGEESNPPDFMACLKTLREDELRKTHFLSIIIVVVSNCSTTTSARFVGSNTILIGVSQIKDGTYYKTIVDFLEARSLNLNNTAMPVIAPMFVSAFAPAPVSAFAPVPVSASTIPTGPITAPKPSALSSFRSRKFQV
jgi:hypothetical protein